MRVLALDIGSKRIGIAISDSLGITARAYKVLRRTTNKEEISELKKIIEAENVERIVVGIPYSLDGKHSQQTNIVLEYFDFLKNNLVIPINQWDERLSTVEASKRLIEANMKRQKRKEIVDKVAATIILEGYLNYQREKMNSEEE